MGNKDLKEVYDEMHLKGVSSWFGQGNEERELILKMGEPWSRLSVLEIGCGEGDLTIKIYDRKVLDVLGIDYSETVIKKAEKKLKDDAASLFEQMDYKDCVGKYDRLVLQ